MTLSQNCITHPIFRRTLGAYLENSLSEALPQNSVTWVLSRLRSASCLYFMNHVRVHWHDLAENHDFEMDQSLRNSLIESGIYFFPVPTKQCSISAAHTRADIDATVDAIAQFVRTTADRYSVTAR